ncbi:hypothetical protein BBU94A_D03 (plasmid) [Borreliella burgdorferi 94a]|nr:hypothetical protein BBU94A_D03 [Borreliella burgdorferi 94a]
MMFYKEYKLNICNKDTTKFIYAFMFNLATKSAGMVNGMCKMVIKI